LKEDKNNFFFQFEVILSNKTIEIQKILKNPQGKKIEGLL
jgi:hypothetical protein